MALHAKLQLSAGRWRAPLWPVVLPLCDWLTCLGGVETSSFFRSFALLVFLSSLLFLAAVLYSLSPGSGCRVILCTCLFGTIAATFHALPGTSPSPHQFLINACLAFNLLWERRGSFYLAEFSTWVVKSPCMGFTNLISTEYLDKCFPCITSKLNSTTLNKMSPHVHLSSTEQTSCIWVM